GCTDRDANVSWLDLNRDGARKKPEPRRCRGAVERRPTQHQREQHESRSRCRRDCLPSHLVTRHQRRRLNRAKLLQGVVDQWQHERLLHWWPLCDIDRTHKRIAKRYSLLDEPGHLTIAWTLRHQTDRPERRGRPDDHASQHQQDERQSFRTKNALHTDADYDRDRAADSSASVCAQPNEPRPASADDLNRCAQFVLQAIDAHARPTKDSATSAISISSRPYCQ